jgi:[acyl-carrier-protein] S-malonyltransferase
MALLFPGQGAQYIGMGKTFYETYPIVRQIFEQADDLLKRNLSEVILNGPEEALTETKTAQPAIFVTSYAILEALRHHFSLPTPICTAGLSLGEYTALTAAGVISFEDALKLVSLRGALMHEACERHKGTMLVVMGLADDQVKTMVNELRMPNDIWCANFNCPGQVVVSGTPKGVEAAATAAKSLGAKRTIPLQVHGAFHSQLMNDAKEGLKQALNEATLTMTPVRVAMNVTGQFAESVEQIRSLLVSQVTSSVLWHSCVTTCATQEISCFMEVGCGKTLTNMNKRIGVNIPSFAIETTEDLHVLESLLS